jgi:hypothetical protein
MSADPDFPRGLPRWPNAAGEESNEEPQGGGPYDDWLLAVLGVLYPLIGFVMILLGGGAAGPIAFGPSAILAPPLLLIAGVIGARSQGARLRWGSVAVFVGWVLLVACGQWLVWAAAVAAV